MINIPFQERRCPSMRMSETTKEQNEVSRVHPSPSCSQGTIDDEWTSFVLHVLLHSSSTVQSKPVLTQGHPGSHSIFLLVPRSQLVLEQTCNVRTILSFLFRWQKKLSTSLISLRNYDNVLSARKHRNSGPLSLSLSSPPSLKRDISLPGCQITRNALADKNGTWREKWAQERTWVRQRRGE